MQIINTTSLLSLKRAGTKVNALPPLNYMWYLASALKKGWTVSPQFFEDLDHAYTLTTM